MHFNLDLIRHKLFAQRDVIANDFGVGPPAKTPCDFADQIITALAQFAIRDPMHTRIGNEKLFEAF